MNYQAFHWNKPMACWGETEDDCLSNWLNNMRGFDRWWSYWFGWSIKKVNWE